MRRVNEERDYLKENWFGMVSALKVKKGKTSKFLDSGSKNWYKREKNLKHGMDREGKMEM